MKKKKIEWSSPCHFESAILKEFFTFINFMFVTWKWENKNAPTKSVTQNEINVF